MSDRVLECQGVTHAFRDGDPLVLHKISLTLSSREFVSIVGASGSGKTTLLRILVGLITPLAGRVLVDGVDVTGQPGTNRATVFQADRLYPWRTALRNVTFGLEVRGVSLRNASARAQTILSLVGLPRHGHLHPHQLSGGMRQRVNVARALAVDPDFLLMDEPLSALDAQTREMMQLELLGVWRRSQKGIFFVTHSIEEAVYLSDRVLVLGARPGSIRREVIVALPRPRPLAIKRRPEFQALCDVIWREIQEDVKAGMAREQATFS